MPPAKKKPGRCRRGQKASQEASEATSASTLDPVMRLPVEIWLQIIGHLGNFTPKYSLHKTCRALRIITLPCLYNTITFCNDTGTSDEFGLSCDKLLAFTQHILTHPHHGLEIRKFYFTALPSSWSEIYNANKAPRSGSYGAVLAAMDHLLPRKHQAERWKADLQYNGGKYDKKDALVPLLLAYLPSIRKLTLRVSIWSFWLNAILTRAAEANSAFKDGTGQAVASDLCLHGDYGSSLRHLEEIVLHSDGARSGVSTDICTYFLQLPAIRTFRSLGTASYDGFYGIPNYVNSSGIQLLEDSCGCEHIELLQCRLNNYDIQGMLSACYRLKTFRYEMGFFHAAELGVVPKFLEHALEYAAATLENLWIDLTPGHPEEACGQSAGWPIRLGALTNLRYLKVHATFILSPRELMSNREAESEGAVDVQEVPFASRVAETIPSSIERLHLIGIVTKRQSRAILSACDVLVSNRNENHKHLAELVILIERNLFHDSKHREYFIQRVRRLQDAWSGVRVSGKVKEYKALVPSDSEVQPAWNVTND